MLKGITAFVELFPPLKVGEEIQIFLSISNKIDIKSDEEKNNIYIYIVDAQKENFEIELNRIIKKYPKDKIRWTYI